MRVINQITHVIRSIQLSLQIKPESLFEFLQGVLLEAWEPREVHELDQVPKGRIVLSHCDVGLDCFGYIKLVGFGGLVSSDDVNKLLRKLEVG